MYDNWMKIGNNTGWGCPVDNLPAKDKVAALFSRNINRGLRTHDCSILCYAGSIEVRLDAYFSAGKFVANPEADTQANLTAWEGHADKIWSFNTGYDKLNATTKAHIDTFQPLHVYIGGPPRNETAKDHIYWAGEDVDKGIVAINDHQRNVAFSVDWAFKNTSGTLIDKGTKTANSSAQEGGGEFATPVVVGGNTLHVVWETGLTDIWASRLQLDTPFLPPGPRPTRQTSPIVQIVSSATVRALPST